LAQNEELGSIGPSILERFEAGAALADLIEHVEQVARRSGQPIKPRDHEHVARRKPSARAFQTTMMSFYSFLSGAI
jgi:hypothetical protein